MPAPANDLIANATVISGASGSVGPVTIDDATKTDTEDFSGEDMQQTIWFKLVAAITGRLEVSTQGSLAGDADSGDGLDPPGGFGNLDTKLKVWHGTTPGSLTQIAYDDDAGGGYYSALLVHVTAGDTYYIQVGTFSASYTGTVVLTWSTTPTTAPNDDVANALVINGATSRTGCSTQPIDEATLQPGETSIAGGFGPYFASIHQTLWWRWIADTSDETQTFSALLENGTGTLRVVIWWSPDGSDDYTQFLEVTSGSGSPIAIINQSALLGAGQTYYFQVGTSSEGVTGDVQFCWDLASLIPLVEVDDCPIMVAHQDTGDQSVTYAPHSGDFGTFSDGYVEWYEPVHQAGELLLWIGIGDRSDSAPAGYTTVLNTQWDNAATDNPSPRGAMATYDYPVLDAQVQLIIAYRIATVAGGGGTPVGTYTGITYTDAGFGRPGTAFGARVYSFQLTEMWGWFDQSLEWPTNPVKVGDLNSTDYARDFASDQVNPDRYPTGDDVHAATLAVDDVTADHIGNHAYVSLLLTHGLIGIGETSPGRTTFDLRDQFYMPTGQFDYGNIGIDAGNDANPTIGGYNGYNSMGCQPFLSNRSYFNPFVPYSWVGDAWAGHYPPTHVAENGFSDHTLDPGRTVEVHSGMNWWDGPFGTPGSDFYNWILTGGAATIQIVIQGPEVHRPINDNFADAYDIMTAGCQVTLKQCTYGQTPESGETFNGLGNSDNSSVWFKFTPDNAAVGTVIRTWRYYSGIGDDSTTTENSILIVYDSGMNVIASNDDYSGPGYSGSLSQVTVDLSAAETYYIQVVGYGGDEGELYLTIDAEGACQQVAYWGILATAF